MNRKHTQLIAAGAATAVLAPLALLFPLGQAGATPGSGVSSTILSRGTTHRDISLHAKQPTELVFARVTLQPGGSTGWHTHPGPLLAVVESGTLTHYDRDCHAQTYAAGQVVLKETQRVHLGANTTSAPVVLDVTYIVSGQPAERRRFRPQRSSTNRAAPSARSCENTGYGSRTYSEANG